MVRKTPVFVNTTHLLEIVQCTLKFLYAQIYIKKNVYENEEDFFIEESYGAYSGLIEELQKEPKVFDVTKKKAFPIWASL